MNSIRPEVVLVNPPIVDPTTPPHFAAYLAGCLKAKGLDVDLRFDDLSVGALNYLFSEKGYGFIRSECDALLMEIEGKDALSSLDEVRYRYLQKIRGIDYDELRAARKNLTDGQYFYSFDKYKCAAALVDRYVSGSTALSLPGIISFWEVQLSAYGSLSSTQDLANDSFISAFFAPFRPYLNDYLEQLKLRSPSLIGISCNYISQLPFALFLAKEIYRVIPESNVCIGGTEITDLYKHADNLRDLWSIFPKNVVLVIGEGESAFCKLIEKVIFERIDLKRPAFIHENVVSRYDLTKRTTAYFEDINNIGSPDYSIYEFLSYWSPEPVLMYSPTRGCYWNKCTFCDYGLNFDSPTSPSRQRDVDMVEVELRAISNFAKVVYFAVDAISPSYLIKMSEMMCSASIDLSWSAEIRLEKKIRDNKLAKLLKQAGCVGLSFGLESASPRVLKMIDKGVDIEHVPSLIASLAAQGIHVQLMGFVGFPGETREEADLTFSFLDLYKQSWTLAGIGGFVLTPGAIVARNPSQFGIKELVPYGGDIKRSFKWIDFSNTLMDGERFEDIRRKNSASATRVELSRPFVGGIDTFHSLLYFRRYPGLEKFLAAISEGSMPSTPDAEYKIPFSMVMHFTDFDEIREMYKEASQSFSEFLVKISIPKAQRREARNIIVKPSGNIYIQSEGGGFPAWLERHFI